MLFGCKLPFATPRCATESGDRTVRSMFVYGVAYALASISCTIGLFVSVPSDARGFGAGVANVVAFGSAWPCW